MRAGLLAFALGVIGARWWPGLAPGWVMALIGMVGLGLALRMPHPGSWLGLALMGLAWALLAAARIGEERLPLYLDGRTLWVEGKVTGLPTRSSQSVQFDFGKATSRRTTLPTSIRVSWRNGPPVRSGERWRLALKLSTPRGQVNPGGFDYEAWLFARGTGAIGSVKHGYRLAEAPVGIREYVRQRLLASNAHPNTGLLVALVLGDGSALAREQWRVLQATGTVHLFVISGQHVGLLAGLLYGLVATLARLGWWPARWPWLPCACVLAALGALGYGALAGFGVPVQRACLMIMVTLLWRWRFRGLGVFTPLLLALAGVLAVNPKVTAGPGFWLSFTAVIVLLFSFAGRLGAWPWWRALLRAQWRVALALGVVMSALGLAISFSGPVVNLVAVPWISLVVLPLALVGTLALWLPWGAQPLLWLAGSALDALLAVLTPTAQAMAPWLGPQLPWWAWLLAAVGACLLLLPGGVSLRLLGVPMVLQLGFAALAKPDWGQAQVVQLDVGQGLAILVRTRRHSLLFDTGPGYGDSNAGERVVVPSLQRLGVRQLDALVLSHAHDDHTGGAQPVIDHLRPVHVLAGEPQHTPALWQAQPCQGAEPWVWDEVRFVPWRWPAARDSNPASCVLLVIAKGERLLLTGDIDAAAERALLRAWPHLEVDWLQAPHHGSRTSTSTAFLNTLTPSGVLISRGWNNRFGHPHAEVLARLKAQGITPLDSALHGAVEFYLGSGRPASHWRQRLRPWRATGGAMQP
jgi:competence protein ComEC